MKVLQRGFNRREESRDVRWTMVGSWAHLEMTVRARALAYTVFATS